MKFKFYFYTSFTLPLSFCDFEFILEIISKSEINEKYLYLSTKTSIIYDIQIFFVPKLKRIRENNHSKTSSMHNHYYSTNKNFIAYL